MTRRPRQIGEAVAGGFHVGDRVVLVAGAGRWRTRHGVVVGESVDRQCIRVRRDGHKDAETWSPDSWKGEPFPALSEYGRKSEGQP